MALCAVIHAFRTISPRFCKAKPSLAFFGEIAALSRETFETQIEKCAAWVGTPQRILDIVGTYRRQIGDFEIASLQVNFNDVAVGDAQASMRLFGEAVLPRL